MLVAEEELAVKVAQIDGVEVNNVDLSEARKGKVLEELASDATGAYHQHTRLFGDG